MTDILEIEMAADGRVAVVTFKAASISSSEKITAAAKQIKDFIEENHPDRMVFDFAKVKFFSSQVLGLLLDIRARMETANGQVVISAIDPRLHKVFRITNLDRIFQFFGDRKNAVEAMSIN
jgi:anti-anti-sigma factor